MSVGKSSSSSSGAQTQRVQGGSSSTSSSATSSAPQVSTQQPSTSSKNRPASHAAKEFRYCPPEECRTWYHFRQNYEDKFGNEKAVAQYTLNERIEAAWQARDLVATALEALERNIARNQGTDSRRTRQRHLDRCAMVDVQEEKRVLDEVLASVNAEIDTSKFTEENVSQDEVRLDADTTRIIAGLREQNLDDYAERKRNGRRPNRSGLVDGLQILDDYTLAKIAEFNRKLATEERRKHGTIH